ncbi:hypothetical protein [Robiginitalea sp. SC105]|uniref:hypothetical protein n=1 Tax=Robiginitalea sp. SC105 TaxID=2762332 RepID=UPI001639AD7C|nr:hypothetical protein [Robiginitalea sp. SC105]MBC2838872.1 hypothetical protein [Robiginitalea sp. SC105]
MSKFNIAQTISVLANVAVLGGLIFLAYETRQNTTQLRAAASYSFTEALYNLNSSVYDNQQLAGIITRGEQDLVLLDSIELVQFVAYQLDRVNLAIHMKVLESEGVVDVQFPYDEFLIQEFHRKPGLQQFMVMMEGKWVGASELYKELRLD